MMFVDGNDGEARGTVGDGEHSDSGRSHDAEGDVATISEVFDDILTANEDLLHAAAECQLDNDAPSILAYQRVLHRNLIEMADFVDAVFGVYNQASADRDDASEDIDGAHEDDLQAIHSPNRLDADPHDDINGHTSEEANEFTSEPQPTTKREPERMGSLLIDRFRLENRRRSQQRSARLWKKMRRRVRVEEGVSAVSAVMFEAAERIAQLTVTGAAHAPATSAPVENSVDTRAATTAIAAAEPTRSAAVNAAPEGQASVPSAASAPPTPVNNVPAEIGAAGETPIQSPPPAVSLPLSPEQFQVAGIVDAASLQSLQFAHPSQQFSMSMFAASLPLATQGSSKLLPAVVDKFTKVLLPPMASGFNNLMFPMAAAPAPTLFPPDHMSTVCADCVPLNRTAHECRSVRKHITPAPPVQQSQAVMFAGSSMWPMAGLVVNEPARPVPSNPVAAPNSAQIVLKKVCEECKKGHKGSHHCRKVLGHTAPEWLSNTPAGEGGSEEPPKRKRRSKKQIAADNALKAAERAAAMAGVLQSAPNAI